MKTKQVKLLSELSLEDLRRAVEIKEQITQLENALFYLPHDVKLADQLVKTAADRPKRKYKKRRKKEIAYGGKKLSEIKVGKKLHWTQTEEGRAKVKLIQRARYRKQRKMARAKKTPHAYFT